MREWAARLALTSSPSIATSWPHDSTGSICGLSAAAKDRAWVACERILNAAAEEGSKRSRATPEPVVAVPPEGSGGGLDEGVSDARDGGSEVLHFRHALASLLGRRAASIG